MRDEFTLSTVDNDAGGGGEDTTDLMSAFRTQYGVNEFLPGTTVGQFRLALSVLDTTTETGTAPIPVYIGAYEIDRTSQSQPAGSPQVTPFQAPNLNNDRQDSWMMWACIYVPPGGFTVWHGPDELRTRTWRKLDFGNTIRLTAAVSTTFSNPSPTVRIHAALTAVVLLP